MGIDMEKGGIGMKRIVVASVVIFCMFILSGCASLKLAEAEAWLTSKAGSPNPAVDISGSWQDSIAPDWGTFQFTQKGGNVTGTIPSYNIKGVVNGNSVYLVIYFGEEKVDYTAVLELQGKELKGNYFRSTDPDQKTPLPMALKKNP
jgi:hypothetical protein